MHSVKHSLYTVTNEQLPSFYCLEVISFLEMSSKIKWYQHNIIFPLSTGGATLVFSVELLDLQKPPMFNIPMNRELWIYVGGFVLVVFVGYELYRRAAQQNKDLKKQQKKPSREHPSKKSKKKK